MKSTYFFWFCLFLYTGSNAFAQQKPDKKMKEALEQRYKEDKYHAEVVGPAFREEIARTSWVGGKLSEMYKRWGAPTKAFADELGGKVVVFEAVSNFSGGSYTPGYSITTTRDQVAADGRVLQRLDDNTETVAAKDSRYSYKRVETTTVYVNKDGVITKVDYKTNRN